jgi:hypothetical protein
LKTKIRSLTGVLLFLCLTAPVIGLFFWLEIKKEIHRETVVRSILRNLPAEELSTLKLSYADANRLLRWEKDYEFEYQGNMYDAVSIDSLQDTVIIICWHDSKETDLNKSVRKIVKGLVNNDPVKNKTGKSLFQFFKTLYFEKNIQFDCPSDFGDSKQLAIYINHYKGTSKKLTSPPPKH